VEELQDQNLVALKDQVPQVQQTQVVVQEVHQGVDQEQILVKKVQQVEKEL